MKTKAFVRYLVLQTKRYYEQSREWFKKLMTMLLEESTTIPKDINQVAATPPVRKMIALGMFILIFFVGGFLIWALFAPLDTAIVAQGKIIVSSNRKSIQHLEGGIVQQIYVQEGSQVRKGDKLIMLDPTQAKIRANMLENQYFELLATEARLVAERDDLIAPAFPEVLTRQSNIPDIKKSMDTQIQIFNANQKSYQDNLAILNQRVEQLKNEINSLNSQAKSFDSQLALINEEITAVMKLEAMKYIDKPKLLALKREAARLTGNRDEQLALAARAEQRIGETKIQMIGLKSDREKETVKDLDETTTKIADVEERLKSAQDILTRTLVLSPINGKVVKLQVHTVSGVVSPGQTMMDIVPESDKLIAEVKINPNDIESIHPNQDAKIRLVAYKQRTTPTVDGLVTQVSADSLQDDKTLETYYLARIVIDPHQLETYPNVKLYPGMPVQAMIVVARKTPMQYFLAPIEDSFTRAFREE